MWGGLFLLCVAFTIWWMGNAIFVMLGIWQDDDGVVRWHPEFLIFMLVIFGIPIWIASCTGAMG